MNFATPSTIRKRDGLWDALPRSPIQGGHGYHRSFLRRSHDNKYGRENRFYLARSTGWPGAGKSVAAGRARRRFSGATENFIGTLMTPLSPAEMEAKFRRLTEPTLGKGKATALYERISCLADIVESHAGI